MTFSELQLSSPILKALEKTGYTTPTPIQEQSIPPMLKGKDIFGCAQTGTGKTAAFALPILQLMSSSRPEAYKGVRTLILAPTRELVIQIHENMVEYSRELQLKSLTIYGGVSQFRQTEGLKNKPDILIATPGRLLDLMQQGFIKLNHIQFFVLDEADRMLDMGFINDIKKIIPKLPQKKQTAFFSATVSESIMKLANTLLYQPVKVAVAPVSSAAETVKQKVYYVTKEYKRALLEHLLKEDKIDHALVFTRTKRGADRIAKELNRNKISAEAIHGNKSQNARERALNGFKDRSIRILVATDIAARGIDVDKLTHVFNFEIPDQAETYVHRIGRTGRAGESGVAISFCTEEEKPYLQDINKLIKKNITVVKDHPFSS